MNETISDFLYRISDEVDSDEDAEFLWSIAEKFFISNFNTLEDLDRYSEWCIKEWGSQIKDVIRLKKEISKKKREVELKTRLKMIINHMFKEGR